VCRTPEELKRVLNSLSMAHKWKYHHCFVMHGHCDARFMVTFPADAGIKLILFGDRGTCVNNMTRVARVSAAAWI